MKKKEDGMNRFEGKVALVTGAGSRRGIGRGTALALAKEGAKVVITDIVQENVDRVVAELNEISQARGMVADVRSKEAMVQVVEKTTEVFGGLDILINVAGLTRPTLFLKVLHRTELINDSDFSIIAMYQAEYRGLVEYYRLAYNLHRLTTLEGVMEQSLTKTLAAKYKLSVPKIYRK